jgi:predicted trehalose synthase
MKCYRVVDEGERPEIEMLFRLDGLGFNALLAPVARWHERDIDLALVREFLPTALEGRLLALTSLRDLLAHASLGEEPPSTSTAAHSARSQRVQIDSTPDEVCALAGGDLASEMQRLGQTTGSLHLALADAFGEHRVDVHALVDEMTVQGFTEDLETDQFGFREPNGSLQGLRDGLAVLAASNTGKAIRLHGEYHLRRVMRSDSGWIVVGFSDDPLYSRAQGDLSLAARMGSPLEDLADMCFSLGVVAREALLFRPPEEKALATDLALAWTRRNRAALLRGYLSTNGIESLVPEDPEAVGMLLSGYEIIREHRYDAASFD